MAVTRKPRGASCPPGAQRPTGSPPPQLLPPRRPGARLWSLPPTETPMPLPASIRRFAAACLAGLLLPLPALAQGPDAEWQAYEPALADGARHANLWQAGWTTIYAGRSEERRVGKGCRSGGTES